MFNAFNYVFALTLFINQMIKEKNLKKDINSTVLLRFKSIQNIYDENRTFIDDLGDIKTYFDDKCVQQNYKRIIIESPKDVNHLTLLYQELYQIEEETKNLLFLIDREDESSNDILYIVPNYNCNNYPKLYANYLFGFNFISSDDGVIRCYLLSGIKTL